LLFACRVFFQPGLSGRLHWDDAVWFQDRTINIQVSSPVTALKWKCGSFLTPLSSMLTSANVVSGHQTEAVEQILQQSTSC